MLDETRLMDLGMEDTQTYGEFREGHLSQVQHN